MNRKRLRELVYQKYDGHCAYCGREIAMKDMQVDHIVSRYNKGTKIAQMSFYKTLRPRFSFVDELTGFDRGGGLGHTGSK